MDYMMLKPYTNEFKGFVSDIKVMDELGLTKAQFDAHVMYQRLYKGCVLKEKKGLNQCIRCKYEHDSAIDEPCVSCSTLTNHFEPKEHDEIDMVNHPQHYNRDGAIECIDEMIAVFGKDIVACFCLCNVWKYRYRASDKGHEEDLSKSDYYMAKYKELITGRSVLGFESVMEREELADIVKEKLEKSYTGREIKKNDK